MRCTALAALSLVCCWAPLPADVADYINLKNKTDLSGLSTSIAQFGMRFGMLLGSVGVAAVLAIGGYSGEAANARPGPVLLHPCDGDCGLRRNPPGVQYFAGAVQQPDGCPTKKWPT